MLCILAGWGGAANSAAQTAPADPFEPTVTRREADLLRRASELAQEDVSAAISFFRENRLENASPAVDFALGNFYYESGRLKDAELAYKHALKKLPRYRDALNNLGRVYLLQDEPGRAMEAFQVLLRDGEADADMLLLLGHCLLLQQEPVSAEGAYRQSLVLRPGRPEAMRGLVKCLIEQERHREALALTTELLGEQADDRELWAVRANAHIALAQPDEAIASIETARRLGAASPALLATLGDLYVNRRQPREAVAAYEEGFAAEAPSPDRMLRAARALLSHGAAEEADAMLRRLRPLAEAGVLSPAQQHRRLRLEAQLAAHRGDAEAARSAYTSLIRNDPLDGEALLALAGLQETNGRVEEARMLYERAARISGFEARALARHAQLEVDRDRYGRAVELLESALVFDDQPHVERYLEQVRRLAER